MDELTPAQHVEADAHAQLLDLYQALLGHEARYGEFKELLALYPAEPAQADALEWAALVGTRINTRLREWIGDHFHALTAMELRLWRSIVVEARFDALDHESEAQLTEARDADPEVVYAAWR